MRFSDDAEIIDITAIYYKFWCRYIHHKLFITYINDDIIHQATKQNVNYLIKRDDCIFCIKMLKSKQYKGTLLKYFSYSVYLYFKQIFLYCKHILKSN